MIQHTHTSTPKCLQANAKNNQSLVVQQEQSLEVRYACFALFFRLEFFQGSLCLKVLCLLKRYNSFFDGIFHDKSNDIDFSGLVQAVDAIHCLVFDRGVPPDVKHKCPIRSRQIDPNTSGMEGAQDKSRRIFCVRVQAADSFNSLARIHRAINASKGISVLVQGITDNVQERSAVDVLQVENMVVRYKVWHS